MPVKTTGKVLKQFWNAEEPWWPTNGWVDDDKYIVNGNVMVEGFEPNEAKDADLVTIMAGAIYGGDEDGGKSLVSTFKKWLKTQTTVTVVLEMHKDDWVSLQTQLPTYGAKVISQ